MLNNLVVNQVLKFVSNRRIVILGYGNEGRSSFDFFRQNFPQLKIVIADQNMNLRENAELMNCEIIAGENYLSAVVTGDFVMKSPGISFKNYKIPNDVIISSQTDLFLKLYGNQTIGVTGTKGKSTTVSLICHILKSRFDSVYLVGNIGIPALSIAHQIQENTKIVYEMSSHQLEFCYSSPHIGVLLNLHQEHLDHYKDYEGYRQAKWQVTKHQNKADFFIYNSDDITISQDLKECKTQAIRVTVSLTGTSKADLSFREGEIMDETDKLKFDISKFNLRGSHNIFNLMVSIMATHKMGMSKKDALEAAYSFQGLPHRIEFVGVINEIQFYNDSIATIPEAAINALHAIPEVETLILGGFDRGIDYQILIDFLLTYKPLKLLLMGKVGERIFNMLSEKQYQGDYEKVPNLEVAVSRAFQITSKGKACLLSPAAASYDSFKNFEDRGDQFKKMVLNFGVRVD